MEDRYIFISYARANGAYVQRMASYLARFGVTVWMDDEIPTGERWEQVLEERVSKCAALLLVMSPAAAESFWVSRELDLARSLGKPVLPVLVEGQVIFGLDALQHEDLRDRRMPGDRFVRRLRDILEGPGWVPTDLPRRVVQRLVGVIPNAADCYQRRELDVDIEFDGSVASVLGGEHEAKQTQILSGLAGVGKSQLAAELARRARDEAGLHCLAWISASSRQSVLSGYAQAAAQVMGRNPTTRRVPRASSWAGCPQRRHDG